MRYLISGSNRVAEDILDRLTCEYGTLWSRIATGGMRGHFADRDGVMVKILSSSDHIRGLSIEGRLYVVPVGVGWFRLLGEAVSRIRISHNRTKIEYLTAPDPDGGVFLHGSYAPQNEHAEFLAEDPTTGDWLKVRPLNNPDLPDRTVLHAPSLRCFVPNRWMPIPA